MTPKASLNPFHDNLILEPIAGQTQIGSIIVPDKHVQTLNQGKVVDRGPLVTDAIKLGDIVFFAPHSENRLDWKGNKFIVVTESNCLGSIIPIEVPQGTVIIGSEPIKE